MLYWDGYASEAMMDIYVKKPFLAVKEMAKEFFQVWQPQV